MNIDDYADVILERQRYAYNLVREQLNVQTCRRKHYYDLKLKPNKFQIGDWVWHFSPRRRVGKSIKWQCLYSGPYLITDIVGPVNYVIQRSANDEPRVIHVDKIKLYLGDTPKSWLDTDYTTPTPDHIITQKTPNLDDYTDSTTTIQPALQDNEPTNENDNTINNAQPRSTVTTRPPWIATLNDDNQTHLSQIESHQLRPHTALRKPLRYR